MTAYPYATFTRASPPSSSTSSALTCASNAAHTGRPMADRGAAAAAAHRRKSRALTSANPGRAWISRAASAASPPHRPTTRSIADLSSACTTRGRGRSTDRARRRSMAGAAASSTPARAAPGTRGSPSRRARGRGALHGDADARAWRGGDPGACEARWCGSACTVRGGSGLRRTVRARSDAARTAEQWGSVLYTHSDSTRRRAPSLRLYTSESNHGHWGRARAARARWAS